MNLSLFYLINKTRAPILDVLSVIISSYLFLGCIIAAIVFYVLFSPLVIHKTRTILLMVLAILLNLIIVNGFAKHFFIAPRPYMVLPNVHTLGIIKQDSTIISSHVSMIASIFFAVVFMNS
jgi:hypothetical protein